LTGGKEEEEEEEVEEEEEEEERRIAFILLIDFYFDLLIRGGCERKCFFFHINASFGCWPTMEQSADDVVLWSTVSDPWQ